MFVLSFIYCHILGYSNKAGKPCKNEKRKEENMCFMSHLMKDSEAVMWII